MTDVVDQPVVGPDSEPDPDPATGGSGSPTPPAVPRAARVLGAFGRFLITAGVVVFLFIAYELWGTNLHEARAQDDLRSDLDERFAAAAALPADPPTTTTTPADEIDTPTTPDPLPTPDPTLPGGYDPEVLELFFPPDGAAISRLELPTIGVDKIVVRGVDVADLRKGPGHYPATATPGGQGNSGIAGHRTTYGSPFNRIDELAPGDEITVTGIQGESTYRVLDPRTAYAGFEGEIDEFGGGHIIVRPSAIWVLDDFGDDRLTLTACHPKLSSRQRIIVAAELVSDPVDVPAWALDAQATVEAADDALGADEAATTDTVATDPVTLDSAAGAGADDAPAPTGSDPGRPAGDADLDTGLSGERDAIPGAVLWLLAGTVVWFGAGMIGRRLDGGRPARWAIRGAALVPGMVCLWFAFEHIDRALPAA